MGAVMRIPVEGPEKTAGHNPPNLSSVRPPKPGGSGTTKPQGRTLTATDIIALIEARIAMHKQNNHKIYCQWECEAIIEAIKEAANGPR